MTRLTGRRDAGTADAVLSLLAWPRPPLEWRGVLWGGLSAPFVPRDSTKRRSQATWNNPRSARAAQIGPRSRSYREAKSAKL
jgi:hypothetical protein